MYLPTAAAFSRALHSWHSARPEKADINFYTQRFKLPTLILNEPLVRERYLTAVTPKAENTLLDHVLKQNCFDIP